MSEDILTLKEEKNIVLAVEYELNDSGREYEISFILKNDDQSLILKALKDNAFAILKETALNKVKLAYPIKKENQAYFGYVNFQGQPGSITDLIAGLKMLPEALRFLIITPPIVKKTRENGFSSRRRFIKKEIINAPAVLSNEALEKKIEEILK